MSGADVWRLFWRWRPGPGPAYLAGERIDLPLRSVQACAELAVLLVAQLELALHLLQLQTRGLALRLAERGGGKKYINQSIKELSEDESKRV